MAKFPSKKTISVIFLLLVSSFLFAQDSLQLKFERFSREIEKYQNSLDSISFLKSAPCGEYLQMWKFEIAEGKGGNPALKGDEGVLCNDKTNFDQVNETTSKAKDFYGLWSFTYQYIGNKYVIVTGEQAPGSINQQIYYYEAR